jgi:hypothetical protein
VERMLEELTGDVNMGGYHLIPMPKHCFPVQLIGTWVSFLRF